MDKLSDDFVCQSTTLWQYVYLKWGIIYPLLSALLNPFPRLYSRIYKRLAEGGH